MPVSFADALAARGIDAATVKRRAYYHATKHRKPTTKQTVKLQGGPWHGQALPLTPNEGGTLPINCNGYRGAYLSDGRWQCLELLQPARRRGPDAWNMVPA